MSKKILIGYSVLAVALIVGGSTFLFVKNDYSAFAPQPLCVATDDTTSAQPANCTGGGTGTIEPCDVIALKAVTNTAISTTDDNCVDPVCEEGNEPTPVPGSVKTSRDNADNTAEGTRPEIATVVSATKSDIESGGVYSTLKDGSTKVYDSQAQAQQELQKKWETSIVPRLKIEYYEAGWTKVNGRTNTSANQAKGFFGYQYSKDLEKWGPQATGQYSFLRTGSADLTGRAVIGGFSYNGQQLDSGFADLTLTGTWNILGDNLQAVAAYSCEIGQASGATSVTGRWSNLSVRANWPVWIKKGNGAFKVTLGFEYRFTDKRLALPFGLNWSF